MEVEIKGQRYDLGPPVPPSGPAFAKILIVGEAPGESEQRMGAPFVGQSGDELTNMLRDAGIDRHSCRITNVTPWRPPTIGDKSNDIEVFFANKTESKREHLSPVMDRYPREPIRAGLTLLERELAAIKPDRIIALGGTALWALSGYDGITAWRGSMLTHSSGARLLPTLHPALVLRQWAARPLVVNDLKKLNFPHWGDRERHITVVHSNADWIEAYNAIRAAPKIAVDIETRKYKMACIGVATSMSRAFVFPMLTHKYVLDPADYAMYFGDLYEVLRSHPYVIGQNFLYDAQYFAKQWGLKLNVKFDTMLAQHLLWPGDMRKSLDFMSSLYLPYHVFWKDDGKKLGPITPESEDTLWHYNGKDACITFELEPVLSRMIEQFQLKDQWEFQMRVWRHALKAMLRGCRYDIRKVPAVAGALRTQQKELERWLAKIVSPHLINAYAKTPYYASPKQVMTLLYDRLGLPVVKHPKSKKPTSDDDALEALGRAHPVLSELMQGILEYRSAGVFSSNFLEMEADSDERIRCSYNPAGTETFRFASSTNAFDTGGNLQNMPRDEE